MSCVQSGPSVQRRFQNTRQRSLRGIGDDTLPADIPSTGFSPPSPHLYKIPTYRKRAVIIGNSALVGYPCFCMLQRMGCTCSICHKDTVDVPSYTREVRCVFGCSLGGLSCHSCRQSAHDQGIMAQAGSDCRRHRYAMFEEQQWHLYVIDSSSNLDELVGDADLDSCLGVAGSLTPVPGGVALLTTAMLMKNAVQAMIRQETGIRSYEMIRDESLFDSL